MSQGLLNLGVTGMIAQGKCLEVIGNNIANSQTVGYKRGKASFEEAYYSLSGMRNSNGTPNQVGQGVGIAGTTHDWTTGITEETSIMTHLAVLGNGFLAVERGGDTFYTRAGDFGLVEVTAPDVGAGTAGEYVLARPNGAQLVDMTSGNPLTFTGYPDSIIIESDGQVYVGDSDTAVGTIGVQRFAMPDALDAVESGLYKATSQSGLLDGGQVTPGTQGAGVLKQGALERANVDLTVEFTEMIAAQRAFQANSRSVTTADSLLQEILSLKR